MIKISPDTIQHWKNQYHFGKEYLIPFLQSIGTSVSEKHVLDLNSEEGGALCSLVDEGATGTVLESNHNQLMTAKELASPRRLKNIRFISDDFHTTTLRLDHHIPDLILLIDILNVWSDHHKVMTKLRQIMGTNTYLFVSFPPFYSPFGGHQRKLKSWLNCLPYFHLLPSPFWQLLQWYISKFDANSYILDEMKKLRQHKLTINSFLKLVQLHGMKVVHNRYYLTRPSYRIRFGGPVLITNRLVRIPILREFLISGTFFILEKNHP